MFLHCARSDKKISSRILEMLSGIVFLLVVGSFSERGSAMYNQLTLPGPGPGQHPNPDHVVQDVHSGRYPPCVCNEPPPQLDTNASIADDILVSMHVDDIPTYKNWTAEGAVTAVKNQLPNFATCWAFAAVAAVESLHFIKTGELLSLSTQELVDCVEGTTPRSGCLWQAYEFIAMYGITTEEIYPYTGFKRTCDWEKVNSPAVRIDTYSYLGQNNENELMQAVARQPISVVLNAATDDFQTYSGGVFRGECGTSATHGVTIVGYGETEDGVQYWVLKNSWGPKWAEQGYMRLLRGFHDPRGKCGIAIEPFYPITTSAY